MGQMALRAGTARSVVLYRRMGLSLEQAGQRAMEDLRELGGRYLNEMSLIALDQEGPPAAFSNIEGNACLCMTATMDNPQEKLRTFVPMERRWGTIDSGRCS